MYGINGAEIVFNPSATVGALSEPLWPIEARNAAIANSYFAVGINRVGTVNIKHYINNKPFVFIFIVRKNFQMNSLQLTVNQLTRILDIFMVVVMLLLQMAQERQYLHFINLFILEYLIVYIIKSKGLSRLRDGLLVTEVDLNLCRQTKDKWGFRMTQRLDLYAQSLTNAIKPDYKATILK